MLTYRQTTTTHNCTPGPPTHESADRYECGINEQCKNLLRSNGQSQWGFIYCLPWSTTWTLHASRPAWVIITAATAARPKPGKGKGLSGPVCVVALALACSHGHRSTDNNRCRGRRIHAWQPAKPVEPRPLPGALSDTRAAAYEAAGNTPLTRQQRASLDRTNPPVLHRTCGTHAWHAAAVRLPADTRRLHAQCAAATHTVGNTC